MRRLPFLCLLLAGCGGNHVQNVQTISGERFRGHYFGSTYVQGQKVGKGEFHMDNDTGVIVTTDRFGNEESYLVFPKNDGSFIGNRYGQGLSDACSGTIELAGKDIAIGLKTQWRTYGNVVKATRG